MRRMHVVLALAVALTVASRVGAQRWCAPATPTSASMAARLRQIVSAEGTAASAYRARLHLPALSDTNEVGRVADDSTCHALANAQAAALGRSPEPVLAVRIGRTRFIVYDRRVSVGEWESLSIYDDRMQYRVSTTF